MTSLNDPAHPVSLCDLSCLQKLGVKGPDAASWLASKGFDVPKTIFASSELPKGGVLVRVGSDEFFLEDGFDDATLPGLSQRAASHKGELFRVERQDATLLLVGPRSQDVLAQTCSSKFDESARRRITFTRVAGVSCGVFPESINDTPAYRIWVDPSYAVYLWETLSEICQSLGGGPVESWAVFPEAG